MCLSRSDPQADIVEDRSSADLDAHLFKLKNVAPVQQCARTHITDRSRYAAGLGSASACLRIPSTASRRRSTIPLLSVLRISTGTKCLSLKPVERISFLKSFSWVFGAQA